MSKLDRSFVYRKFKKTLIKEVGKEKAKIIWKDAGAILNRLLKEYKYVS